MQPTTGITQSVFVNKQTEHTIKKTEQEQANTKQNTVPIEGDFVRLGSQDSQRQAEDVFARNHEFADIENLSYSVRNGLQAYTNIDISNKKEEISKLMGVDLFA